LADSIGFDFSEIVTLTADLGVTTERAGKNAIKAVAVTAGKVKKGWRDKIEGTPDMPLAFLTIDYDVVVNGWEIVAEIGSRTGQKQATFVTVNEFGAPGNNSVPHGYGAGALEENSDDFQKGLEIAVGDPLGPVL
jgi:hypothetical protein